MGGLSVIHVVLALKFEPENILYIYTCLASLVNNKDNVRIQYVHISVYVIIILTHLN